MRDDGAKRDVHRARAIRSVDARRAVRDGDDDARAVSRWRRRVRFFDDECDTCDARDDARDGRARRRVEFELGRSVRAV
jgi:hypothetical protein